MLLFLLPPASSLAQTRAEFNPAQATLQIEKIDRALKHANAGQLGDAITQIGNLREQANHCASSAQADLGNVDKALAAIGPVAPGEPAYITRQRDALLGKKAHLTGRVAECRLLVVRIDVALSKITAFGQQLLTDHLTQRGPTDWDFILDYVYSPKKMSVPDAAALLRDSGLDLLTPWLSVSLLALALAAAGLGFWLKRMLLRAAAAIRSNTFVARLGQAITASLSHYSVVLLPFTAAGLFMLGLAYAHTPFPILALLPLAAVIYVLLFATAHFFLAPFSPARKVVALPSGTERAMTACLKVLLTLITAGVLLYLLSMHERPPYRLLLLGRAVLITLFTVNLIWLFWIIAGLPPLRRKRHLLRAVLSSILLFVPVSEWLGYRNLSIYLLRGLLLSMLLISATWFAGKLIKEFFEGLDSGHYEWQRRIRARLGLKEHEHITGVKWLLFLATIALWSGFILGILRVWGMSDTAMSVIFGYLSSGFTLGKIQIVPLRIIEGLFIFSVLTLLLRWARHALEKRWLARTRMDRGEREALVTIVGYVGFTIALLIGLSIAGVNLASLAIIAGAMSVGIGFGLQNVVNNFISGIILLFERPIKVGDWIAVGGTEGYVRKISIRSTQIQTFDRADVIVPNSELISNQVTNWMFHDMFGRIRVPVGVAYGSDTALVKQLLLDIANAHDQVIKDHRAPPPKVYFLGFGDSALNFELRCVVHNINNSYDVRSDLNFAIDAAFRKHGIEMPFTQRDVHIRDWPSIPSEKQEPSDPSS
ncbi:MAG: mechanosensitive ion channel family protein [Gammaproteobacteria bacterium]|nr:mechanosensitive ion channel family protein [Gammaproteobacteria bacterium]